MNDKSNQKLPIDIDEGWSLGKSYSRCLINIYPIQVDSFCNAPQ